LLRQRQRQRAVAVVAERQQRHAERALDRLGPPHRQRVEDARELSGELERRAVEEHRERVAAEVVGATGRGEGTSQVAQQRIPCGVAEARVELAEPVDVGEQEQARACVRGLGGRQVVKRLRARVARNRGPLHGTVVIGHGQDATHDSPIGFGRDFSYPIRGTHAYNSTAGRSRIAFASEPYTAAASVTLISTAIVVRGETWVSRRPAASGPSGAAAARSVFDAAIARPSSRSGISAYEYAAVAASVFGKQNACTANAPARTYTLGRARNTAYPSAAQSSDSMIALS